MEPAGSSRQFHPLDEEHIESPIPEVKSTVSIEDDPDMAILTICLIVIGSIVCVLQAYFQSMALIKDKAFDLNMVMVEFGILTMGRFMEEYMPDKDVPIPWTTHKVRLNPGPFNHKEHVLITVATHMGRMRPHVLQTVVLAKGYFGKEVYLSATIMTNLILTLITFLLAGLFNNWVTSPEMWWPAKLVDVAFFRTWHDKQNVGPSGIISNKRFFYVFFGLSFAYQILPGYVFPSMTCVSVLCWFWNNSIRAQQIGSGRNGLGLFSFSLDWPSISEFSCDPLSTPSWVIYNVLGGIIFAFFIMTPAIYWTNAFDTKKFPIFTTEIFDSSGYKYNMSKVLNADRLTFNITAYDEYSVAHLSAFRIGSYGLLFGAISSSVVHVILNYGSAIWKQINHDVHNQRMRSYKPVPTPWFYIILALVISLGIGTCVTDFGPEIQFPTVGIILIACVVSLVLLPPLGILAATANLLMPVNLVFVLLGGFLYPGQQFKYMIFTNAGYQIAVNTVVLLGFQKLGHYMKLPPKGMFLVQLVASLLRDLVSIGVVWCHADTLKSNCNIDNLPVGSPWSCPSLDTYYTTASLWGILGSHRIIGDGRYKGFILSVVFVSTVAEILVSLFSKKWNFLKEIKLPIVLAATSMVPPAIPANINSWLFVGVSFPLIICKLFNYWSPTRQYLLSLSFTTGAALTGLVGVLAHAILIFFQFHVPESWGSQQEDPCGLARCPTAPGTAVNGCPVI